MIWLNDHKIEVTMFPDNTSQVWQIPEEVFKSRLLVEQHIHWEFEHEGEFLHVAQLCDLIAAKGGRVDCLYIPYFPYARQDKEISNHTTFAKQTFVRLLESLPNVMGIMTDDIHSDMFNGTKISSNEPFMQILDTIKCTDTDLVAFPDKGAKDRYQYLPFFNMSRNIHYVPQCSFTKVRNQDTGRIERLTLNELTDVEDRVILIVDDLCDRGGTFIMTAQRLYELGAKEVHLYTTHGLYTGGTDIIFDSGIKRIFNRKGEVPDGRKKD